MTTKTATLPTLPHIATAKPDSPAHKPRARASSWRALLFGKEPFAYRLLIWASRNNHR